MGLMEMNLLLKKEMITLRFGGRTDILFIYGQSFFNSENGPSWAITFQSRNWPKIFDKKAFSSSENDPNQTVIFIMKMVRWIVNVP
jgi:hypothetical protein